MLFCRFHAPIFFALLSLLALSSTAHANPGWRQVAQEDGITVTERQLPGQVFPTFRGVGVIQANIYDVLAVVSDIERHPQWVENCETAQVLQRKGYREYVVYSRTDVPWPISDRDAVLSSTASINTERGEVVINFRATKSKRKGKVDGVVRMENLRGHYKFKRLDEKQTYIDYQVDADPGGWLPTWMAKLATRKLPLNTIRRLRKRVELTRGWYDKRIKQWKAGKF